MLKVNGVLYIEKGNTPLTPNNRILSKFVLMAAALGGLDGLNFGYERKRPNVDIVSEYGLIQQKKSKLSRSDRDWVVFQFEKRYEPYIESDFFIAEQHDL